MSYSPQGRKGSDTTERHVTGDWPIIIIHLLATVIGSKEWVSTQPAPITDLS